LEQKLRINFNNRSLLKQALVHSSYLNENPQFLFPSNERLEFLGDAFIGLIVARELYLNYPSLNEGEMTRLRAAIICRETLARQARKLDLGKHLILSKGEEASAGREKERNLAGAFEAVLGALLVDRGWKVASRVATGLLKEEIRRAVEGGAELDYKSQLQELVQKEHRVVPTYRITRIEGPEHQPSFTAEVFVGDKLFGIGTGTSKRKAEREAARVAIAKLEKAAREKGEN
jgi:ribonuclease-3